MRAKKVLLRRAVGVALCLGVLTWIAVPEIRYRVRYNRLRALIRSLEKASDTDKAEQLWAAYVKVQEQRWSRKPRFHGLLRDELEKTGEAWMHVMLQELRNAPSVGSGEACYLLSTPFGRRAMPDLLALLDGAESEHTRAAALTALLDLAMSHQLDDKDTRQLAQIAGPLLDDESWQVRSEAFQLLEVLEGL